MELSITSDGGDFRGNAIIFFVFNGRTAGTLPLAYLSEGDDGLLDILVLKGDTPLDTLHTAIRYLPRCFTAGATRKASFTSGAAGFTRSATETNIRMWTASPAHRSPSTSHASTVRCQSSFPTENAKAERYGSPPRRPDRERCRNTILTPFFVKTKSILHLHPRIR